jgi:Tol biopolymer transport system component
MRRGNRDVRIMGADGRDDRAVTSDPAEELYPTLSPRGEIAYQEARPQLPSRIIVRSRDAAGAWSRSRVISSDSMMTATFPRWSPDGKWIAWISQGLWLADPASGSPHLLFKPATDRVMFAAWGQDSRLVYVHLRSGPGFQVEGESSFWAVPVGGGAPRLLLRLDATHQTRRQEFATDGRRLFFTIAADESDIYLMELKR